MNEASKSRASGDAVETKILKQRVFLYLQAKSIKYNFDDIPSSSAEIEVEHIYNTITSLSDQHRNIIRIDKFDMVKPTFSVTIEQDSLENITKLSDSPILLTLYVYTNRKSKIFEGLELSHTDEKEEEEIRTPVAQGHIDIVEYVKNKRTSNSATVFLYPLKHYDQILTCKTEWEIYSLHPLLKTMKFSNFLFITLNSLYNFDEEIMADCQHLGANLSFISKIPKENNDFDKIFICNFKIFSKSIISQQRLTKSWESLKNYDFGNINCMGISSESKININHLFSSLLSTENVDFNFKNININENFALICNSMHRYVLTDDMQKILADTLSRNLYHIILEIYSEMDKSKILLQGYIDLSVFMYPEVNNCSFAIELKPPDKISTNQSSFKERRKSRYGKRKSRNSQNQQIIEVPIPFAIVQICLNVPITNPCQNIDEIYSRKPRHNQFCQYTLALTNTGEIISTLICEKNYRAFDDLILEIIEYMVNNNVRTMNDDREFFSNQLSNINNKIMKLVACDFNIKTPTKTNIEFKNLMTTVYRDLTSRIHDCLSKCTQIGLDDCILTTTNVNFIILNMSVAKYLYEVGNIQLANVFMNTLRSKYPNNTKLKFFIFLYETERQNFAQAQKYLNSSLDNKDTEGEQYEDLIKIYINYQLQKQDSALNQTAEETLINALSDYIKSHKPTSLTALILLYCMYKKYDYQAGMEYCRWRYENLYDSKFIKLEFIPQSRWEIYMPHKVYLKSLKEQNFIKVCFELMRLGLYDFGQCVFSEIADECMEIERYFFSSTLLILANKLHDNVSIENFSLDNLTNSIHLRATLSLVHGNLEHCRHTNNHDSTKHYQDIVDLKELDNYTFYQLGLLRFAYKAMSEEKYEEASQVFLNLCNQNTCCIVAAAGRGKACYHMGQLDEAEKYFGLSTEYGIHIASTWAYLALINLRNGNNFNALECWKYAEINKTIEIHEDIMSELKKINYNDICLFVDVPDKI